MNKNLSKILLLASIGAMPLGMAAQQASSFVFSGKVKDIKGKGIAGGGCKQWPKFCANQFSWRMDIAY